MGKKRQTNTEATKKKRMVSFLMPALNEEQAIATVIKEIKGAAKQIANAGFTSEIVVIDGKSTDRTASIAKKMGARVVPSPRGYGIQYQNGIAACKGEIIITGDADCTYPFSDTPKMLRYFLDNDLLFLTTNRFAHLDQGAMRPLHKFGNTVLTMTTRVLYANSLADSQSGMWIFYKSFFDTLSVKSHGMPFSQEIKIKSIKKAPRRVREIPISYRERQGDVKLNTFKDGLENLASLFLWRFK